MLASGQVFHRGRLWALAACLLTLISPRVWVGLCNPPACIKNNNDLRNDIQQFGKTILQKKQLNIIKTDRHKNIMLYKLL